MALILGASETLSSDPFPRTRVGQGVGRDEVESRPITLSRKVFSGEHSYSANLDRPRSNRRVDSESFQHLHYPYIPYVTDPIGESLLEPRHTCYHHYVVYILVMNMYIP